MRAAFTAGRVPNTNPVATATPSATGKDSYEYLDLGDNQLSNTLTSGLAAGGTVSGDYSPSHVQFIALTINKTF